MSNNQPPSTEFSFDLYPGLDSELDDAYRRNVQSGMAVPGEIATSGLAAAVAQNVAPPVDPNIINPDVAELAEAAAGWTKYGGNALPTMSNFINLLPKVVDKLTVAKEVVGEVFGVTPEDQPIAETMKLALIPWQEFRDHLDDIPGFVSSLREIQGITTEVDFFNPSILEAIVENKEFYRDPNPQPIMGRRGSIKGYKNWISAKEYLDKRIATDGAWGVMMAQASDEAGAKALVGKSPNNLTDNGVNTIDVNGHKVYGMGIFEWLALTLAEDPSKLSSKDLSWLIANRLDVKGTTCVPDGDFYGGRVRSDLDGADGQDGDIRPRLAVIGLG